MSTGIGTLPGRNPGMRTRSARSCVACVDGVVDVVGRDLDRQARPISVELLELRLHRPSH